MTLVNGHHDRREALLAWIEARTPLGPHAEARPRPPGPGGSPAGGDLMAVETMAREGEPDRAEPVASPASPPPLWRKLVELQSQHPGRYSGTFRVNQDTGEPELEITEREPATSPQARTSYACRKQLLKDYGAATTEEEITRARDALLTDGLLDDRGAPSPPPPPSPTPRPDPEADRLARLAREALKRLDAEPQMTLVEATTALTMTLAASVLRSESSHAHATPMGTGFDLRTAVRD
jgi:hypothetical protein